MSIVATLSKFFGRGQGDAGWNSRGVKSPRKFLKALHTDVAALRAALWSAPGGVLLASATNNFANLTDGSTVTLDVTVPGAQLGDFAMASLGVDMLGVTLSANVKSADIVTVTLQNESGSAHDYASTAVLVAVIPLVRAQAFGLLGSVVWDPADAADGVGESKDITVTGAALGDFVLVSFSLDTQGILLGGAVKSADTVTARLQNETTSTINLASGRVRALVIPRANLDIAGAVVNDYANLVDAAGASLDVTTSGAAAGGFALASVSVDIQGMLLTAAVKSTGIVTTRLQNETAGAINLASATVRTGVVPAAWFTTPPTATCDVEADPDND